MLGSGFDQARLASVALGLWRRGGLDTLVTARPIGSTTNAEGPIGLCATLRLFVGRPPAEIAGLAGLGLHVPPAAVEVFAISPLPEADGFRLDGYVAAEPVFRPGEPAHPLYLPGRAPRWMVSIAGGGRLRLIATAIAGQPLQVEPHRLPPVA